MKTILYMAVSLDGKITKGEDDTSWVEEFEIQRMDSLMKECGVMLMGRRTYEDFGDDLPNDSALQVVMTNSLELLNKVQENVIFTNQPFDEVFRLLETKGFTSVLIAGGEDLNSRLLAEDKIDEIRLLIKSIIIGEGKSLFKSTDGIKSFKLNFVEKLSDSVVELKYSKK